MKEIASILRHQARAGNVFDAVNDTVVVTRPLLTNAADEIERLRAEVQALKHGEDAENERLRAVIAGIAEFCSGDDRTLGAIARLAHIRNTADQAMRRNEQRGDDHGKR